MVRWSLTWQCLRTTALKQWCLTVSSVVAYFRLIFRLFFWFSDFDLFIDLVACFSLTVTNGNAVLFPFTVVYVDYLFAQWMLSNLAWECVMCHLMWWHGTMRGLCDGLWKVVAVVVNCVKTLWSFHRPGCLFLLTLSARLHFRIGAQIRKMRK